MGFFKKYLQSRAGRVCLVGSTITVAAQLIPNTICLDKLEAFYVVRFRGKPVPVQFDIKQKFEEVLNDMKLPQSVKSVSKIFNIDGFNVFHAGTPNGQLGGILIGAPAHFSYTDVTAFNNKFILVGREQVDWERRDAKRLLETLIISDEAQKFAIASEIARVQSGEIYKHVCTMVVAILIQPIFYNWAKKKFQLQSKSLPKRLGAMVVTSGVVAYLYFVCKDAINCRIDSEVDTAVSELGPEYIKGGQEYYEKVISRNLALRSLLEKLGERYFTPEGNARFLGRYRTLPFTERKAFFDEKLSKIETRLTTA